MNLTKRQEEAREVLNGPATHVLLEGGSQSGKTSIALRNIIIRGLKAPGSIHAVFRFRFAHVKDSIGMQTLPWVMREEFPQIPYDMNRSDWYLSLPGGSQVWLAGLDDKERTEKVLGLKFATIMLNEISQIPWSSRNVAVTRLSQKVSYKLGGVEKLLAPKMYYDCNPPPKTHWGHKVFHEGVDPDSKRKLEDPERFAWLRMNPRDNEANLPAEYIRELMSLPDRLRKRFWEGLWGEATAGAFWTDALLEKTRVDEAPEMIRIVVAIDPSGASEDEDESNDEVGIIVAGLGVDGHGYVLEDLTLKAAPEVWGKVATDAFERHAADIVVGEVNFGGDMVRFVVQAARPNCPFKKLTASRGKVVRAEPISVLHAKGKIHMVGYFPELEDELLGFSNIGYTGLRSPNRADAMIWAMSELFPGLSRDEQKQAKKQKVELMPWVG